MDIGAYIHLAERGIETAVWVSAPVLVLGLVAGLAVSIFQAATQINDAALAFIPKIGAVIVALVLFGPFMLSSLIEFTKWAYGTIPSISP
ncbi:MAG: flagellar biosynthetic protein FliQ [Candidatus Dadabacteria bacterium]|nr:MAG: flagellar biosynthetic protein FliQ [Candidatus Dadabacteria bacterium]